MQAILQLAKYGAAALAGLLVMSLLARLFVDSTVNSPSAKAEGAYFKMEREAQQKYKGLSSAQATNRYANELASKELGTGSADERAFKAAQIFIGFYLVNARARAEFCQEQKVDIGKFVGEFSRLHQAQYARAINLLEAHGTSVEQIWSTLRASLRHAVEQDMWSMGGIGMSMETLCQDIAHRPSSFAAQVNLVKRQPDVQRALMGP
jgi:hypothetical protein